MTSWNPLHLNLWNEDEMNFEEFYKNWVEENIQDSEVYGDSIKKYVVELCKTVLKQGHGGSSWPATLWYFQRLLKDYDNQ